METGLMLLDADKMVSIATTLKEIVTSHRLYTDIEGRKYVWVEGWCLGGNRLGLTAIPKTPIKLAGGKDVSVRVKKYGGDYENIIIKDEIIYGCEADIVRIDDCRIVGHGYSICSNIEPNKIKWAEYAIASMSQTRAISRAYRNTIGFVMKLMGNEFVATPAEEMDFPNGEDKEVSPKAKEIIKKWGDGVKPATTIPQERTGKPLPASKPFKNDTIAISLDKVKSAATKWNINAEGLLSICQGLCNTATKDLTEPQKQLVLDWMQDFTEGLVEGVEYKRNPEGKIYTVIFPPK